MADEVEQVDPRAVVVDPAGYMRVDYPEPLLARWGADDGTG